MNKKGISPFIASVFLISLTIVLASIVFSFTSLQTIKQQEKVTELYSQPLLVNFKATFSSGDCITGGTQCGVREPNASCYTLLIENQEDMDVDYYIWTEGQAGVSFCGPIGVEKHTSELINVFFDLNKVGVLSKGINARVIPAKP